MKSVRIAKTPGPRRPGWRNLIACIAATAILGACVQVGPKVLTAGRPLYNVALQQTEAQQLLLNIIRQRYGDPVLFLDVTSISSSFHWEANAGLARTFAPGSSDSSLGTLGANVGESPLITYAPNTGEKFVRQMLTPLDLRTVALIVQAGWSIERVLLILGESVNNIRNRPEMADPELGYIEFEKLASALRNLQRDGSLSVGMEPGEGDQPELSLMVSPKAARSEDYLLICKSIDVVCDGSPLRLRQAFGVSSDGKTMALATRSLFSALYFLAQGIDVPRDDLDRGIAAPQIFNAGGPFDNANPDGRLFHVRTADDEPEGAAVKVFYRDRWFYIADNDGDSKTTFALVSMLQLLQSGETNKITPLITLPVN
ncbi:MAG: hypothetical protein PVG42_08465 [Lysobacterales bacterium]